MKEWNNKINLEQLRLRKMSAMKEELDTLNQSLNKCIELTKKSVKREGLEEKLETLQDNNQATHYKNMENLENEIETTRRNLDELLEEEKQQEQENQEEEDEII